MLHIPVRTFRGNAQQPCKPEMSALRSTNQKVFGNSGDDVVMERIEREREYFDELVVQGSATRNILDRFSKAFYEKGVRGRLWAPVWQTFNFEGTVVLDYGCGAGDFSLLLASRGAQVYGVDISPKLIEQAQASVAGSALNGCAPKFLVADAHHTPFKDSSFDYVFGNGALHHLDLSKAFPEIARVLKPGGKAVFQEPMYYHPALWLVRRLTSKVHTVDERPLLLSDLEHGRKWFRVCRHREHFLLAVFAAPVHLLGTEFALSVIGGLDRFDGLLMRAFPALRSLAWLTVMELEK